MTDAKRHRTGQAVASENLGYNTYYGNNIGATSYAARDADDRENILPNIRLISTKKTWKVS